MEDTIRGIIMNRLKRKSKQTRPSIVHCIVFLANRFLAGQLRIAVYLMCRCIPSVLMYAIV